MQSAASLHSATKAFSNPVKRLCPFTIVVNWKRQSLRENIAYKASIHLDTQSSTVCKCTSIFTRPVFSVFASHNNIFENIDADKMMVVNLQFIRVTQEGALFYEWKSPRFSSSAHHFSFTLHILLPEFISTLSFTVACVVVAHYICVEIVKASPIFSASFN